MLLAGLPTARCHMPRADYVASAIRCHAARRAKARH